MFLQPRPRDAVDVSDNLTIFPLLSLTWCPASVSARAQPLFRRRHRERSRWIQGVERVAVFMIRLGPMAECCWRDTLEGGSADVDGNDRVRWVFMLLRLRAST